MSGSFLDHAAIAASAAGSKADGTARPTASAGLSRLLACGLGFPNLFLGNRHDLDFDPPVLGAAGRGGVAGNGQCRAEASAADAVSRYAVRDEIVRDCLGSVFRQRLTIGFGLARIRVAVNIDKAVGILPQATGNLVEGRTKFGL